MSWSPPSCLTVVSEKSHCQMSQCMIKAIKWPVCLAKTPSKMGIHPVWSESLLSIWRRFGFFSNHKVYSKDSYQTWRMSRLIFWIDFCFTALQHILGHFRHGQLPQPHCSWASLPGSLPVLSAHYFAINWQLLFLNQRKRENGRRNYFMTKSPWKNVSDVGIELGAACMPSGHASDRAAAPGQGLFQSSLSIWRRFGFLSCHKVYSEDSDQTWQMPRLIWESAGRTSFCRFRHALAQINVASWLIKQFLKF